MGLLEACRFLLCILSPTYALSSTSFPYTSPSSLSSLIHTIYPFNHSFPDMLFELLLDLPTARPPLLCKTLCNCSIPVSIPFVVLYFHGIGLTITTHQLALGDYTPQHQNGTTSLKNCRVIFSMESTTETPCPTKWSREKRIATGATLNLDHKGVDERQLFYKLFCCYVELVQPPSAGC